MDGTGQAGIGDDGVIDAALASDRGSAADSVCKVQRAVLDGAGEQLQDDATVV